MHECCNLLKWAPKWMCSAYSVKKVLEWVAYLFHFCQFLQHLMIKALGFCQLILLEERSSYESAAELAHSFWQIGLIRASLNNTWMNVTHSSDNVWNGCHGGTCILLSSLKASMCSFLSRSISSRSSESDNDGLEDNSKYISIIFKTLTNIILYIYIYAHIRFC